MEDVLVPLAFFAVIPAIVWAVSAYRHKSHATTVQLLETMAGKGEPITPEIIKTLGVRRRPKHADLRLGLILIAIAVSLVLFGSGIPDDEAVQIFRGLAAFPFTVGLVFLGLWFGITRNSQD